MQILPEGTEVFLVKEVRDQENVKGKVFKQVGRTGNLVFTGREEVLSSSSLSSVIVLTQNKPTNWCTRDELLIQAGL